MASTNINIRMDADLKRQFESFCADMGMSMTTAFTIFAKKAVREYRIPFEVGPSPPRTDPGGDGGGQTDEGRPVRRQDVRQRGPDDGGPACIPPDWLLIYEIDGGELFLYLTRTGTHSDLF